MLDPVGELLAKQAITEVLHRYCRGVDRMDAELMRSCWHAGGEAEYGDLYRGDVDGSIRWMWPLHETMSGHSHQ